MKAEDLFDAVVAELGDDPDVTEQLAAAGKGDHFDPGMGQRMREWAEVEPSTRDEWIGLAEESRAFVSS